MWKKLILALIVLGVLAFIAWQYFKPVPPVRVSLLEPQVQTLTTKLDLNARVINKQVVTITALLDGEIGQINAREGESVEKAQALATLDNKPAQSILNKAQAELAYNEQKLVSTSRTYSRTKKLSNAGNASKQSLDDSLDAFRSAEAALAVSKADVTLAELRLKNATVTAPFAGVVTEQFAETGQWVEAGTPLFTLVAADGYMIEAQVDASDWSKVTVDQSVSLTTESATDIVWSSDVAWIAPRVSTNNRDAKAVAVRFPLGEDAPPLLLGQEVDAELELEKVDDVLSLPLSAMIETEPGQFSVFIERDGKAKLTPVGIGLQNATHAEITDGIDSNARVITSRNRLEHDMVVEVR